MIEGDSHRMISRPDLGFVRLNEGWNADPSCPEPELEVSGDEITLRFAPDSSRRGPRGEHDAVELRFHGCSHYRLSYPNDEGWYRGQCRYSSLAPEWGQFYKIIGEDPFRYDALGWKEVEGVPEASRHFLFYMREDTFECIADDWTFSVRR